LSGGAALKPKVERVDLNALSTSVRQPARWGQRAPPRAL